MKVLFKARPGTETVAAGLFLRGGAMYLTPETAGIENLLLGVMTRGSTAFPRARLRAEMARMASAISSGVNLDYSALSLTCTRANFKRSWDIFADVALRPALAPEDLQLERQQILASLKGEGNAPESAIDAEQRRVIYAGHPYGNSVRGTPETMAKFTALELKRYHQQAFVGTRLVLVIVGDLPAEELLAQVKTSFAALPRGEYRPAAPPPLAFSEPSVEVIRRELPTNYVEGAFAAPRIGSAEYPGMRIAVSILNNRVFEEVRNKRNLSYAPSAYLRTQAANFGGISFSALNANQAVAVMLSEIGRLQHEQVTSQEIAGEIANWMTLYYSDSQTNAAQAGELARYEIIGGGWRNSTVLLEHLRRITPADIQRAAIRYMHNLRFVVLGNPAQVSREAFTNQPN
jgi:predicted Zn-dependent peptidase